MRTVLASLKTNSVALLLFYIVAFPLIGFSQNNLYTDVQYEVNKNHSPFSITESNLRKAYILGDLYKHFKSSWVKEYISIEVAAQNQGIIKKASSTDENLTDEQLAIIKQADQNSEVSVIVNYIPDNTLVNNESQIFDFNFSIDPVTGASYQKGQEALDLYLNEAVLGKISKDKFRKNHLTAVTFTVNEVGKVIDVIVAESSSDEATDKLLHDAICNMPDWIPASYADGEKENQNFVLTVGDRKSCVLNLFNTQRDLAQN